MIFGEVELALAEGAILAHAQALPGGRISKGTRLTRRDLERLAEAGHQSVIAARLEDGDLTEDEAAGRIAEALAGSRVGAAPAATGRANLYAGEAGLLVPDRDAVDRLNAVDPAITLATLPLFARVEPGRMVATVKIIPLAVAATSVEAAEAIAARAPVLRLRPFRPRRVGLIQTVLAGTKTGVLDKTRLVTHARLEPSGSRLVREARADHRVEDLARVLAEPGEGEELSIVFGASAVIDADDVIPAAIRRAGGHVEALGMPVDPGNLLLLGRIGDRIVLGAPGCARSPRENGFDWVLDRLMADLPVTQHDLAGMGVGGLLMEIAMRPQPREAPPVAADPGSIVDVVLLAAGRSSRMEGSNKLLATFDGVPLIRRSAQTALSSGARRVVVVLGHMEGEIREALSGLDVDFVANPSFVEGLSSSLRAGFEAAMRRKPDGILVMLADQPLLRPEDLDQLIAAFNPAEEGSIVVATDDGRRANPVVLSTAYAGEIARLEGDVGARAVVQAHRDWVRAVEIGAAASFDVDTPDLMRRAGGLRRDDG